MGCFLDLVLRGGLSITGEILDWLTCPAARIFFCRCIRGGLEISASLAPRAADIVFESPVAFSAGGGLDPSADGEVLSELRGALRERVTGLKAFIAVFIAVLIGVILALDTRGIGI